MTGEEQIHGQNHTLLPMLIAAVRQSTGPVLELGMGNASTPNLHELLRDSGRLLYSIDNNIEWVDKFLGLGGSDWHKINLSPGWSGQLPAGRFGAVLIDHYPSSQRIAHVMELKDRADFIVVHDIEHEAYGWKDILPHFKLAAEDRRYRPWTGCVSNVKALDWKP